MSLTGRFDPHFNKLPDRKELPHEGDEDDTNQPAYLEAESAESIDEDLADNQ